MYGCLILFFLNFLFLKLKEIDLEVVINLFFIISLISNLVNNNFKVNNL